MDVSSPLESCISGSWRLTSPLRVGSSEAPLGVAREAIFVIELIQNFCATC